MQARGGHRRESDQMIRHEDAVVLATAASLGDYDRLRRRRSQRVARMSRRIGRISRWTTRPQSWPATRSCA
jgi:hypothetical protein